jgi:hypothetical protein
MKNWEIIAKSREWVRELDKNLNGNGVGKEKMDLKYYVEL